MKTNGFKMRQFLEIRWNSKVEKEAYCGKAKLESKKPL